MPDQRTNRAVGERLELQLERRPNLLHRRRRWLTLIGGLLPLLFVGLYVARGDHSIFLSQPLADSHRHLHSDCQTCHRRPWQPLVRLTSTNPAAKSVRDEDCRQCHDQRKDDHNPLALAMGVADCADCHLEHRGAIRLTDLADTSCVRCHQPFAKHPQFALMRNWQSNQQLDAGAEATMKRLQNVAVLGSGAADATESGGRWQDKTALKFSHREHLAPLAARWKRDPDGEPSPLPAQLSCADCHQLDTNGQYMQPIVFENHCRDCHPLRFSSKLDLAEASDSNDHRHSLPHATPQIVHGVMRQRLIDYARRHPNEVLAGQANRPSRLPNRQPSRQPTAKQEWEWVEEEFRLLENAIFRSPTPDASGGEASASTRTAASNACLKCHEAGNSASVEAVDTPPGFAITPPNIPSRWMPESHFRHDRHLKMQCVACHQATGGPAAASAASAPPKTLDSTTVADILMPSITICQTCHGVTSGSPLAVRARANCTECHQYHHVELTRAVHATLSN